VRSKADKMASLV